MRRPSRRLRHRLNACHLIHYIVYTHLFAVYGVSHFFVPYAVSPPSRQCVHIRSRAKNKKPTTTTTTAASLANVCVLNDLGRTSVRPACDRARARALIAQDTRHRWYQESRAHTRRKQVTCVFTQWTNKTIVSGLSLCYSYSPPFGIYLNWSVLQRRQRTTHTHTQSRSREQRRYEVRLSSAVYYYYTHYTINIYIIQFIRASSRM